MGTPDSLQSLCDTRLGLMAGVEVWEGGRVRAGDLLLKVERTSAAAVVIQRAALSLYHAPLCKKGTSWCQLR